MGKRSEATKDKYSLKHPSRDPSMNRVAGNYPAKKYSKGSPTITRLSFEFVGSETKYIDIASALSAVNRKMYRQGCYYYVNSIEFYDNSDSFVDIHVLPDNWVTRAAHRRGKGIFDEMNRMATLTAGNVYPKYHDFKVYMNDQHRTVGSTAPSLYAVNQVNDVKAPDEWAYSQMVSADSDGDITNPGTVNAEVNQEADNFYLHMIGSHTGSASNWTSVGLVKSYAETRVRQNNANPVIDAGLQADPLFNLFDLSSEEQINDVVTRLDEDNDQTPYDLSEYIGETGSALAQAQRLTTTAESGRVAIGSGFCAPLGLIAIDPPTAGQGPNVTGMAGDNLFRIVLNLAVGTYNGVYAERM